MELLRQEGTVDDLLREDLCNSTITIAGDDIAVDWIQFEGFLPGVQKCVASDDQMLESVIESHAVSGFGDLLHHSPLNLREG